MIGAVAYAELTDPKNEDPVLAARGHLTKMYFRCGAEQERIVKIETVMNVDGVVNAGKDFVSGSTGVTATQLFTKY